MLFAPVPGRADPDREAALRAGSERQGNGRSGRQGQGHRQPRAETGTVVYLFNGLCTGLSRGC